MADTLRDYFQAHRERQCVIIVGDKPSDAAVNHGSIPDDLCLKLGFFDHSPETIGRGHRRSGASTFKQPELTGRQASHERSPPNEMILEPSQNIFLRLVQIYPDHGSDVTDVTTDDGAGMPASAAGLDDVDSSFDDIEQIKKGYREHYDLLAYGRHSTEIVSLAIQYLVGDED